MEHFSVRILLALSDTFTIANHSLLLETVLFFSLCDTILSLNFLIYFLRPSFSFLCKPICSTLGVPQSSISGLLLFLLNTFPEPRWFYVCPLLQLLYTTIYNSQSYSTITDHSSESQAYLSTCQLDISTWCLTGILLGKKIHSFGQIHRLRTTALFYLKNNYSINKFLFSNVFKASVVNTCFSWYTIETRLDQKSICQFICFS